MTTTTSTQTSPKRNSQLASGKPSSGSRAARSNNGNTDVNNSTWGWGKTALVSTVGLATLAGTAYACRSHLPDGVTCTETTAGLISSLSPSGICDTATKVWRGISGASANGAGIPKSISIEAAAGCAMGLGGLGGLAGYAYRGPGISKEEAVKAERLANETMEASCNSAQEKVVKAESLVQEMMKVSIQTAHENRSRATDTQAYMQVSWPQKYQEYCAYMQACAGGRAIEGYSKSR